MNAFSKFLSLCFISLGIALILCSCASSERMMRVSPFSGEVKKTTSVNKTSETSYQKHQANSKLDSDANYTHQIDRDGSRINTWPFLYKINDKTSVIWPMIDNDLHGFAFRPFYNQEGKEYSIMFPLSAWNPENGDGWAFTWYWNKGVHGVFPFYHSRGTYNYLFPVVWDKDYFCSPATLTYISKSFNMAGPVYWNESSKSLNCGFFPVFFITDGLHAFGPFWIDSGLKPEDKTAFGFFPFAKFMENKNYVFPFFRFTHSPYLSENVSYWSLYLFPYYGYSHRKNLTKSKEWESLDWVLLWYSNSTQDSKYNTIIPLYAYESDRKQSTLYSILGAGSTDKKTDSISMLNVMWLLFHYSNDEKSNIMNVMMPLCFNKYDKVNATSSTFVFPYFRKSDKENSFTFAPPLFIYDCDRKSDSFYSLIGAFDTDNKTGDLSMLDIMGFLYIYANDSTSKTMTVLFPLSYYNLNKINNEETTFIFPYYKSSSEDGALSIAPPLYIRTENNEETSLYTLMGAGSIRKDNGEFSMINAMGIFYIYENSDSAKIRSVLFPFTYYKNNLKYNSETTFIFPYLRKVSAKSTDSFLIPLFTLNEDEKSQKFSSLLTEMIFDKDHDRLAYFDILWLLARYDRTDSGKFLKILFPLSYYADSIKDQTETTFIFPYYRNESPDNSTLILLPLYYSSSTKDLPPNPLVWKSESINIFTFLKSSGRDAAEKIVSKKFVTIYHYDTQDIGQEAKSRESSLTVIPPLFVSHSNKQKSSFYSLLFSSTLNKNSGELSFVDIMGFLYIYDSSVSGKTLSVMFPLTYFSWSPEEKTSFIFPFYYNDQKNLGIYYSTTLPFYYYYSNSGDKKSNLILPALLSNYKTDDKSTECNFMFPLGHTENNNLKTGFSFWPLFAYQDREHILFCFDYNTDENSSDMNNSFFNTEKSSRTSANILLYKYDDYSSNPLLPPNGYAPIKKTAHYISILCPIIENSSSTFVSADIENQTWENDYNALKNAIIGLNSGYYEDIKKRRKVEIENKQLLEKVLKKYDCFHGMEKDELIEGLLHFKNKFFTKEKTVDKFNFSYLFDYEKSFSKENNASSWNYANTMFLWTHADHNIFDLHKFTPVKSRSQLLEKAKYVAQKKLGKEIYTNYNLFLFFNHWSYYSRETDILPAFAHSREESNFNLLFLYISNNSVMKKIKTETVEQRNDLESLKRKLDSNKVDLQYVNNILKKYDCYKGDTDNNMAEGIAALDEKFTAEEEDSFAVVPGLFYNSTDGAKNSGNILFLLSRWKSDDNKKQSMINVMEYFFRYQCDDRNSYRDIFPFMSLDNGPEMFRASFLWRFIGYKKEKEERTWYLFFVAL